MDAHLHLDQYPEEDVDRLIDHWQGDGVQGVVAVSKNLASSYQTLELKQKSPNFIHAAVGFHPEQTLPDESETNELLALINCESDQISAIGEVGLPHYQLDQLGEGALEKHKELLAVFIKAAKENQLPLALHAVHDKAQPVLEMLLEQKVKKAHFHWLKGNKQTVQSILDAGYYLSITPEVCYRDRDQELAMLTPIEQLMVETDGPWAFSGPFQHKATTPLFTKDVMSKIAEVKKEPYEKISSHCLRNVEKIYGIL